jgi:hypothetical protein
VIDEARNCVDPWPPGRPRPVRAEWRFYLAHDYGSAAPSVTFVCAESPGAEGPDGRWYPPRSLVLVDELATNAPGQLNQGMGYTIPRLADEIRELAARWGIKPDGVADDAIFAKYSSESIAREFRRCRVYFRAAKKGDRKSGWEIMRRMLADAGKPDVPGLYVSRGCEYFWATVPYLGRDPRRADDVDTRAADHAADAARYACLHERRLGGQHRIQGMS